MNLEEFNRSAGVNWANSPSTKELRTVLTTLIESGLITAMNSSSSPDVSDIAIRLNLSYIAGISRALDALNEVSKPNLK